MTTLISFLGTGSQGKGYETTNYVLNGQEYPEKYISISLTKAIKPKKLILLGTSSSVWDVFFEKGADNLENEWLSLSDKVKGNSVTQEDLKPFEGYLSEKLDTEVYCILISFAKDTKEQIEILVKLEQILSNNEKAILDITHAFRHLPMLALVAARFLKRVKNVEVEHIYYGAFHMKDDKGQCPVLDIDGMLTMLDWVDALTTFDKDGDYGQFADLLVQENFDKNKADLLKQASFFERTTNSSKASEKLNTIFKDLESFSSPIFDLFKPQLIKRLTWFKQNNRGLKEQQLANEYLVRKDYVRSVIYAMEGIISNAIYQDKGDVNNHDARKSKSDELAENNQSFKDLRPLRNTLAHGNRNHSKVSELTGDEKKLSQSLKGRFKNLFG